jgi:hypothetical protein
MMRVITTIVAWIRQTMGKPILGSLGSIFMFNLFLGWTVVGWILMMANAFNLNPVAWLVLRFVKVAPQGGSAGPAMQAPPDGPRTAAVRTMCGGSGRSPY